MAKRSVVAELELTDQEEADLCLVLGGRVDDLPLTLASFVTAGMREYVDMLNGQAMISLTDLRERRLLAILLASPANKFPTDDQIARWFGLIPRTARTFLRSTLARHRNKLRPVMVAAAKDVLATASQPNGKKRDFEARFPNAVVVDMLNDELAASTRVRSPITRKSNTFDTYLVSIGSMDELKNLKA
jgi:hypothetical protein